MIRVAFIIGDYPPEERRLREETAKSFSSAEVEVGILSVAPSPFGGLSPAEIQLVAPYFHDAYLRAENTEEKPVDAPPAELAAPCNDGSSGRAFA